MLRILYLGPSGGGATGRHRADALVRLGHSVSLHDPASLLTNYLGSSLFSKIHYHTGYIYLQNSVQRWLVNILQCESDFDLVWIDGGEFFGKKAIQLFKQRGYPVVLFNHDDPTGDRDRRRFQSLMQALPCYDIATAVRDESEVELRALGIKKVLRIWRTYDEAAHSPKEVVDEKFVSEVCFIGTWMRHEKRDEFLLALVAKGVPIAIWGDRWNKSPHWRLLAPYYRGGALKGSEYVAAIRGAKVCLGLLSKGNRDLHTTRSMEIPYAGGLLCAERTSEHLALYDEDSEAVFWSNSAECADKCLDLLNNSSKRVRIRLAGMQRVRKNHVGNENICQLILDKVIG